MTPKMPTSVSVGWRPSNLMMCAYVSSVRLWDRATRLRSATNAWEFWILDFGFWISTPQSAFRIPNFLCLCTVALGMDERLPAATPAAQAGLNHRLEDQTAIRGTQRLFRRAFRMRHQAHHVAGAVGEPGD